jgi:DNA-binding response OmpR family regulator
MKKILIVEDEAPLRNALRDKLIGEGFMVFEAVNGEAGLELALKEHPDLILLDIVMPKMDGFAMLEAMRTDPWGKKANVIVLTNLNDQEYVLKSFRDEVYDFFVKTDVRIEDLISKIKGKLL